MITIPETIKQAQAELLAGKYSAVDLVETYLSRIDAFDKEIGSFLTISRDFAYASAKKIDKLISGTNRDEILFKYPLLGGVFSFKDLFLTKNIKTTAGSKMLEFYVPKYSSSVYKTVIEKGGILIGKTNCDAWAHGASGENSDFYPTKNPWNYQCVPGGSSSGSAASVSARFCNSSFGTDTGGSIRQPANFCGVYGIKPTYGSISRYGVIAMSSSLDTVGYFANKSSDISLIFNEIKADDNKDANYSFGTTKIKDKYKIGVPKEFFDQGVNNEVKDNVLKVLQILEKNGHQLIDVSLPHTKNAIDVYYIIQPAEVSSNLLRYDGIRYGKSRTAFGNEAVRRILLGTYVLSKGYYDAYYLKAMKVRNIIINETQNVFSDVDLMITPVSPTPAFKLGQKYENPLEMYLSDILTVTANISGIPSLSVPFGFTDSGLPLGFQIMGPRFSENMLFDLSEKFEKYSDFKPNFPTLL